MKYGLLPLLIGVLAAGTAGAQPSDRPAINVNSRYTVETVEFPPPFQAKLSPSLRDRLHALVGSRFDQQALEDLVGSIRREIRQRVITMRVTRGTKPETVKIVFDVSERRRDEDSFTPRLVYNSKENFSFGGDATFRHDGHDFHLGALTDNDELVERFSGVRVGYEREGLAGDRLSVRADVESWRSQWNGAVVTALEETPDVPGLYRSRLHFEPQATVKIFEPLTLQLGVSLQRLQMQSPTAGHELSSAAVATLRFRRRWELTPVNRHEVEASYEVRSASKAMGSDFVYTRQEWEGSYTYHGMHDEVTASLGGGMINGQAPLFERFVLGNSRTLRGWNRFDLDPIGGDRMIRASFDYRYRPVRIIYDTGSVWNRGADRRVRHSLAFGLAEGTVAQFSLLVAFPLRNGAIEPIFIAGLNF